MTRSTTKGFEQARAEYYGLPHVEIDPHNERDVGDFVFRAQHEIDMHEAGEQKYTATEMRKLRTFVEKWKPLKYVAKAQGE